MVAGRTRSLVTVNIGGTTIDQIELTEKGRRAEIRLNGRYAGSIRREDYFSPPRMSGSPVLELPMTTIFELALAASFSVASIPFHSSSCGLMP